MSTNYDQVIFARTTASNAILILHLNQIMCLLTSSASKEARLCFLKKWSTCTLACKRRSWWLLASIKAHRCIARFAACRSDGPISKRMTPNASLKKVAQVWKSSQSTYKDNQGLGSHKIKITPSLGLEVWRGMKALFMDSIIAAPITKRVQHGVHLCFQETVQR